MEPYWYLEFDIKLGQEDKTKHVVKLYKYSEKSVAMICGESFGKSFSKNFKNTGGRFNSNLTINEEKVPGWIFKSDGDTLENLNKILENIYCGNIKLQYRGIIPPDFNIKSKSVKIFNLLDQIVKLIPEDSKSCVLSEDDNYKTTIYYNNKDEEDEDVVTEGDLVGELKYGIKMFEIYQLKKL